MLMCYPLFFVYESKARQKNWSLVPTIEVHSGTLCFGLASRGQCVVVKSKTISFNGALTKQLNYVKLCCCHEFFSIFSSLRETA